MTGYEDFTITMTRGDDRAFQFTVTDRVTGDPVDLTNYTNIELLGKKRLGDPDLSAVINLTVGSGITVTTPSAGLLTFEVPKAQSNALGNRRHQILTTLRMDNPSAKKKTVRRGIFVVQPN